MPRSPDAQPRCTPVYAGTKQRLGPRPTQIWTPRLELARQQGCQHDAAHAKSPRKAGMNQQMGRKSNHKGCRQPEAVDTVTCFETKE
eukprot:1124338-Pelagomonas_calceolata.AAC.5